MTSDPSPMSDQLSRIEQRLGRIEQALGIPDVPSDRSMAQPQTAATDPVAPAAPQQDQAPFAMSVPVDSSRTPMSSSGVATKRSSASSMTPNGMTFENLIGGRLFAAVGALVVVLAIAMFLKLGIDRGWFAMSPALRCLSAGGFGLVLLVTGEVLRRRVNALASAGASSAGIAIVYAVGLAAFHWYNLISAPQAFVLLVFASMLGVFVALRSKLAFVGVLAIIGAYLAPILLSTGQVSPVVMPLYMLALLALGLVLSATRPIPFRVLRYVVLLGTFALGSGWVLSTTAAYPYHVLAFLAMAWGAVHAELELGSRRVAEAVRTGQGETLGGLARRLAGPVLISFGATAWCVGLGVVALLETRLVGAMPAWMVPAAGLLVTFVLSQVLAGHLRVMIDVPTTDRERLGTALAMQSGGLLICTVTLALSDAAQAAAWLAMGVAAIAGGKWLRARALDVYGLALLTIGAARIVLYDSWHLPGAGVLTALGLTLSAWSLLMASAGVAWIAAAILLQRPNPGQVRSMIVNAALGLGLTGLWAVGVSADSLAPAVIVSAGVLCAALMVCAWRRQSKGLLVYAVLVLLACSLLWAWHYLLVDYGRFQNQPLLHPGFLVALAIVTLLAAVSAGLLRTRWAAVGVVRPVLLLKIATLCVVLLTASSFEVARSASLLVPTDKTVQAAAVSVWWGLFAVAGLAVGFAKGWPIVRHLGLGLLTVAMVKAGVIDLVQVKVEWRIASLLALGLLMLGVAIAYAKATGIELGKRAPEDSSRESPKALSDMSDPNDPLQN